MIKRETFIQLIRIISMFSIIACHLVKNHIIGQFLTFGIYSFLFISGYLYCNKNIDKAGKWLVKQYKKITIPVFIYIIFLVVVYIVIKKQFNWYLIPIYLLNLQIFMNNMTGATHLWFLTVIFLCYILCLKKDLIKKMFNKKFMIIATFLITSCIAFLNESISSFIFMVFTFFLGMNYKEEESQKKYSIFKIIILCLFALIIKLVTHHYFDDTPFYNCIIYFIVHFSFSYSLFTTIRYLNTIFAFKDNKIIDYFDKISYYVYITHYAFIDGPISLINLTKLYYLNVLAIVIVSFLSAMCLKFLSDKFTIAINKIGW